MNAAYCFTGGDGKDLRRVTNRALDAELLVLRFVDEVRGDFFQEGSSRQSTWNHTREVTKAVDVHFSKLGTLLDVRVILILCSFAGGTWPAASYSFSPLAT